MVLVIAPGDAKALSLPGRRSSEIVGAANGAQGMSFRLVEIMPLKPGEAERGPHVHHAFEECIHVLAGTGATVTAAGEHPVKAGDTILVPAGELHATKATGAEPLKLLCFFPVVDVAGGTTEYPSWDTAGKSR